MNNPCPPPRPAADRSGIPDPEWRVETRPVDYAGALADMEARAAAIAAGEAGERLWLLEHPPLYTAGTSADPAEMLDARFPVHVAGRGGRYTYHGPGQRVLYCNIDLSRRGRDVRNFVNRLEGWVIAALGDLGVDCFRAEGRIGIWTLDKVVIVTVVGGAIKETPGIAGRVFGALGAEGINVIAIAMGSSECSISLVVDGEDADRTVRCLHGLVDA